MSLGKECICLRNPISILALPTGISPLNVLTGLGILLNKPKRTAEDSQKMILLSLASLWHWTQRSDCTPMNLSIGYWQASRVYALVGQVENARVYGQLCLKASQGEAILPFYLGYAYEALAHVEMVAGNREKMADYLQQAFQVAERISDPEEKKMLIG